MNREIEQWRRRIDEIDRKLARLLSRRAECAVEIGRIKRELEIKLYDPDREEIVIRNAQDAASGYLSAGAARRVFERIIDETRRTERIYQEETPSDAARKQEEEQGS